MASLNLTVKLVEHSLFQTNCVLIREEVSFWGQGPITVNAEAVFLGIFKIDVSSFHGVRIISLTACQI